MRAQGGWREHYSLFAKFPPSNLMIDPMISVIWRDFVIRCIAIHLSVRIRDWHVLMDAGFITDFEDYYASSCSCT